MAARMWGVKATPATEMASPPASARVMAVWMDRESRSSSRLPKNCPEMTAHPAPTPTEKPMASSKSEAHACTPPRASFPPNCPKMNVLMRACACWKKELRKMGTHSSRSCCQMTPSVTSSDAAAVCACLRLSMDRAPSRCGKLV